MKRDLLEKYLRKKVEITLFDKEKIRGTLIKGNGYFYQDKLYHLVDENNICCSCIFRSSHVIKLVEVDLENKRICSHCGKEMSEGYCINGGEEYYCSDDCLHEHMTQEEYLELYDDGNGDSYYTEWED